VIDYELSALSDKLLLPSEKCASLSAPPTEVVSPAEVTDPLSVARVVGPNLEVKPSDPRQLEKELVEAIKSPSKSPEPVDVDGTMVRPRKGSKFAVEILTATPSKVREAPPDDAYKPVPPMLREGLPYVLIPEGNCYAVKIYNDNDFHVAAAIAIDGLDLFHFSKEKNMNYWIFGQKQVSPASDDSIKSAYAVFGFHREGQQFDRFLVGEYSKDPDAKLLVDDDSKLSQITVEFHAAWSRDSEMPADERTKDEGTDQSIPGTSRGSGEKHAIRTVSLNVGKLRAMVTIRYEHGPPDLPRN
jgi:hypothetical protein